MEHNLPPNDTTLKFENLPQNVIQSIYHSITGKNETLHRSFFASKKITKQDIRSLCEKFQQFTDSFGCIGRNARIIIRHSDSQSIALSSLAKFMEYDEKNPNHISAIDIEFSFLTQAKTVEGVSQKPQNYKIELSVNSTDFVSKDTKDGFISELFDIEQIYLSIDYVDYVIAKSIDAIIMEWVKSLEDLKSSEFLLFIKRKSNPYSLADIPKRINNLISIMLSIAALNSISFLHSYTSFQKNPLIYILTIFTIISLNFMLINFIWGAIYDQARKYKNPNIIVINAGDKKNLLRYQEKMKSRTLKVIALIFFGSLNILANVFSSYIYDIMKNS